MTELPLPTVLSLPAVSVNPSVNCLQFSQDGQAFLLTKNAAYILSPDAGVSVELPSVIKQSLHLPPPGSRSTRPLGWLRTMVEFDRSLAHQWPSDCTEWGAVSLGSLDTSLQAVTLSPSNLTADAGCVVALLNSNLELTIWSAGKNLVTGQWIRLQHVTSVLKTAAAAKSSHSAVAQTLRLQSTCIEWSSQPDWGLSPVPVLDASLLAVGNRAGSVTFLRYDKTDRRMAVVEEVSVADRWLVHLAWSGWSLSQDGTCEAMLSCATSDGSVVSLTVRQTFSSKPSLTQISPDHDVSLSVQGYDEKVCDPDGRAVTGMRWANILGRSPILIYHKAGVVHLWSASSPHAAWSGSRAFRLRTQKRSVGSSALSPASGICYVPSYDLSVVSLSDGSFHVVHKLSVDPTLDALPSDGAISSDALSAVSHCVFARAEPEKVSSKDVDRVNGMATYDGCATFMWTYEATRPTDFSYKHDAKHVSTFVVAQMWDENADDRVLFELAGRVGDARCASGETPVSILRGVFLHLQDPTRISRLHRRILQVLDSAPPSGGTVLPGFVVPTPVGDWTAELSSSLRKSLAAHLFGWDGVQSQRIRYAVAAFCQRRAESPDVQQKFAEAASLFLAHIRAHVQLTLMRHLSALSGLLHPYDICFARRTVYQASATAAGMPGPTPALAKEAEELLARLPPAPQRDSPTTRDTRPHDPGDGGSLDELCPACGAGIPHQGPDAESAVCARGHVWARCSVTSFLLATPMARTCVGCSRKAFVPGAVPVLPRAPGPAVPVSGDGDGDQPRAPPRPRSGEKEKGKETEADADVEAEAEASGGGGGGAGGLRGGSDNPPSASSPGWFVRDLLDATRRCPFCGNNFVVLV